MKKAADSFKLSNGYEIPCIGFGTWQINGDEAAENAVINAINDGYRHIDTAAIYKNETGVGRAIKNCGIKRDELFVTSKVWTTMRGYENTLAAFDESMEKLKLEYLD
ncbi:MAG: aldo/keto reductase, partial [Clostridia bacterium]|nr:aldo/keto reductase [Clostridia bacterium]